MEKMGNIHTLKDKKATSQTMSSPRWHFLVSQCSELLRPFVKPMGCFRPVPKEGCVDPMTLSITRSPYSDYKLESRVGGNLLATGTLDVSFYHRHFSPCAPKSPWGHVSASRGTAQGGNNTRLRQGHGISRFWVLSYVFLFTNY